MYKNVFDQELKNGKKYSSYMFWGANDYLAQKYAKDVAKIHSIQEDIYSVYFDEYNFKTCLDYLSSSSLFSPVNVLLLQVNKKIPKTELDALIEACNINTDSVFILCCLGSDVDYKTVSSSFSPKKNSIDVRFFELYENEAINLLGQEAKQKGVEIGAAQLGYLYTMHQKDLSLCVNDLSKLAILQEPITTGIINSQCFGMGSVSIEQFFIRLFSKEPINKDLYMILEEGLSEVILINQTTSFIQQLFTINSYIRLHGQLDIKEIWGYALPKDIAQKRANVAMKFKKEDFMQMLEYFLDLELQIKTNSKLDVNSYVQSSFRNFSAKLR
ncbi:MAG: DNA polymerase III subunit delta [Campylobacterales bacterium]|nr:DNA polymerase III subunit delta [Campylobacterales bacterium]